LIFNFPLNSDLSDTLRGCSEDIVTQGYLVVFTVLNCTVRQ